MAVGLTGLAPWREIDGYLDRALDLAPVEREHWLAELTSSQPGIARILRELLAEREALNTNQFLERSPLKALPALARSTLDGKRVGAYTIERLLGRGGMGEVWLACRSDGRFEAQCAIKFLDGAVSQEKLAERFRREGRLLARLAHPNIARLLDAGATADGKQFLVLEYVDGERIDRYCTSHGLDVEARIRLFMDAVLAVAHAHSNLVVHRDLKPSNVLVTRDGAVKLLDFGIAKLIGVQRPGGRRLDAHARRRDCAHAGVRCAGAAGRAYLLLGRALRKLHEPVEADQAFASAVTHLCNTVDETHPALIEARTLSGQRLKP